MRGGGGARRAVAVAAAAALATAATGIRAQPAPSGAPAPGEPPLEVDASPASAAPAIEVDAGPGETAPAAIDVEVRAAPEPRPVARATLDREAARSAAGAEGDATKALGNVAGVARAPVGGGELSVWGAGGEETQVFVDGVPIPSLFHLGGRRGLVATDALAAVSLTPGAFGARWGRGTGGIVELETRTIDPGAHGAALSVDTVDAGGLAWATGGGPATAMAGARTSLLDRFAGAVDERSREVFAIPRYVDGIAKVGLDAGAGRLELLVLGAADTLTRGRDAQDLADRRLETTEAAFVRVAAPWEARRDDGTVTWVVPWIGADRRATEATFGTAPFGSARETRRGGLRIEHRTSAGERWGLFAGLDLEGRSDLLERRGSLALPRREGDPFVFGDAPASDFAVERELAVDQLGLGAYGGALVRLGPVELEAGLRGDHEVTSVSAVRRPPARGVSPGGIFHEPSLEPRGAVRVELAEGVTTFASAGMYHQQPAPEDRSPVFGTPALEAARGVAASAGLRARASALLASEIVGFGRIVEGIAERSRRAAPREGEALEATGEARALGVTIAARTATTFGLRGELAYTISRSVRRAIEDGEDRPFDADQPHVVTALVDQRAGPVRLGARFRAASGAPRTPVVGAYVDGLVDRHRPIFGRRSSDRLPAFVQLDVRGEVLVSEAPEGLVYLDVQNVTNHENVEEVAYSADFRERADVLGLPIFPVVGTRWVF